MAVNKTALQDEESEKLRFTTSETTKALLKYMVHRYELHNTELANQLDSVPPEARKKLLFAIGHFEAANVELSEVLEYL